MRSERKIRSEINFYQKMMDEENILPEDKKRLENYIFTLRWVLEDEL